MARSWATAPLRAAGVAACAATLLLFSASPGRGLRAQSGARTPAERDNALPPIRHVFVIVLENKSYAKTFGPGSEAPYLADTLVKAGALLRQYYGIGHSSLDNYIAMISGQAPNPETQADCGRYTEFVQEGTAPDGQAVGHGCVYPAHVLTVANQLAHAKRTWKAYMEDMGNDTTRESRTCGHARIGEADMTERGQAGGAGHPLDQYAAKHNPFVYFHAIIDSVSCRHNVVPLTRLRADLRSAATTPNLVFVSPNLCHDGHDAHCVSGEPGGLPAVNGFLRRWVPIIRRAPAFRRGVLIVTFDEAEYVDASACCDEQPGPNVKAAGVHGPGGGRTGAVLLSPFIRPGTVSDVPYNHYSMLRSIEDIFGLPYLGYAGRKGLRPFGADVFTRAGK